MGKLFQERHDLTLGQQRGAGVQVVTITLVKCDSCLPFAGRQGVCTLLVTVVPSGLGLSSSKLGVVIIKSFTLFLLKKVSATRR